jgi:hypothetical protein
MSGTGQASPPPKNPPSAASLALPGALATLPWVPARVEAREDILLAQPGGITIADISITHPLAVNTLAAAATTAGAAAARETKSGATEARHVLTSGAEWLSLCALLC